MKVLDAVPKGRVLQVLGPDGPKEFPHACGKIAAVSTDGTDIVALAKRCVDQTISEMSEYLSDGEVAEVAEALHDMLNRWQGQRTKK